MRLQGDASTQISCRQTGIQLSFILNKVFRDLSFSLSITINLEALTLQITSKPLNCSQSYMAVTSSQRRLFASKLISIFNRLTPHIFN